MQFNTQLTINAEFLFEFTSKEDWIINAQGKFIKFKAEDYSFHPTICLDTNNNVCHIGSDFSMAQNTNTYPVKVYALQRVADFQKPHFPSDRSTIHQEG